jgi:hypothetical protein
LSPKTGREGTGLPARFFSAIPGDYRVDGRILDVGNDAALARYVGPATVEVDLQGRFLMPGIIDGHVHPVEAGGTLASRNASNVTTQFDADLGGAGEPGHYSAGRTRWSVQSALNPICHSYDCGMHC